MTYRNSSAELEAGSPDRKKRRRVVINLSNCRYRVIHEAALKLNWVVTKDDKSDFDLYWTDTSVSEERVLKLKKAQRINHFAGMKTLACKTSMARLLRRVAGHLPSAFAFMPETWVLPNEGSGLKKQIKNKPRWVIVKPDGSCQVRVRLETRARKSVFVCACMCVCVRACMCACVGECGCGCGCGYGCGCGCGCG